MTKLENFKALSNLVFLIICAALIYNKNCNAQPFDYLINKIISQDESINSSKILIEKNKNDVSSAWSSYTPKLNLTIPMGREVLINNDSANTDLNFYELDAKITQNIYDFGATSTKIDIAKNQLELSKVSSENVKSIKILESLTAYLNYIKANNVLKYAKESEARIKSVTRLENEKVARGAGLASNVLQSKARLAGARSIRVRFEGDLAIAKNRFFNVFRELPEAFSTFKEPSLPIKMLPDSEENAINIAKQNNIALKVSSLNLKNSQTKIKGTQAKFLPSLKAVAQYKNKRNLSGLDGTEIDHIYKIEMNYPISIGGPFGLFYKENADYKSSMNQYMSTKYNHDKLERNLEESIRNSWQTKNIAKQNYEFLENQANISGEFFDLAMKEVRLGNRQLIDILSSETAFINAKSSAANAKTEYQLAVYQLLYAIGILDESIFSNKQSYNRIKPNKNIEKHNKILINNDKKKHKRKEKLNLESKGIIEKNKTSELIKINASKLKIEEKNEENTIKKNKTLKPISIIGEDKNSKINDNNISKPITLIKEVKPIHLEKNKHNNKEVKLEILNNSLPKEEKLILKNTTKEYRVQIGAFSKISNAQKYLENLEIINLKLAKFTIEEDISKGLYKIISIKNFNKHKGIKICKSFKEVDINCILSAI